MLYSYLVRKLTPTSNRPRGRPNHTAPRRELRASLLRLELLEDRRLLSTMTTTAVQGYPSTSQYGQPVALVAKVTTTPASPRGSGPTGTVNFYLGSPTGTLLGSANVTQRGTAVLYNESAPLPVAAMDTIYAVYSGDANFSGSQASVIETVNPAATHTVVSASPNPGVAGADVTFTAVVSGAAPGWANNGGQIAPPTGTVTFTVDGTAVPAGSVTFVGDSGMSAIYTYTTSASSLTAGANTVSVTYGGDANYLASTSRTLNYQVVSAANAGSGTITAGSAASPLSLRGGPTFSISYDSNSPTPATSNTVTYVDNAAGINLSGTITTVVFSADGHEAEISGTGTNTTGSGATAVTTDVNFTLFVSNKGHGWRSNPNFSISIVGNTAVSGSTGTGFDYNHSGSLASGNTVMISETGSAATIPPGGGLPGAHDHVLESWPGGGYGGGYGRRGHGRR
jgi:hypothetical protein